MIHHGIFALFDLVHIVCGQNIDSGASRLFTVPRGS